MGNFFFSKNQRFWRFWDNVFWLGIFWIFLALVLLRFQFWSILAKFQKNSKIWIEANNFLKLGNFFFQKMKSLEDFIQSHLFLGVLGVLLALAFLGFQVWSILEKVQKNWKKSWKSVSKQITSWSWATFFFQKITGFKGFEPTFFDLGFFEYF